MKKLILTLTAVSLLAGACKKEDASLQAPSPSATNPNKGIGKHLKPIKDNWVVVEAYEAIYVFPDRPCLPAPEGDCHVVKEINLPGWPTNTDYTVFVDDVDNAPPTEVQDDLTHGYAGFCDLFGASRVNSVIAGTTTLSHEFSPTLGGDWFIFTQASGVSYCFIKHP